MYKHEIKPFGKFEKHTLYNEVSRCSISLVPQFGAYVLEVKLDGKSILDGVKTAEEMCINRWYKNTLLFPFPNRLENGVYEWDGKTYQFPINDLQTNSRLHGFGVDKKMEVPAILLEDEEATIHCQYMDVGDNEGFPWPFTFEVRFRIANPGTLEVEMLVQNDAEKKIPFGFGWHPYFQISDKIEQVQLKLPPCDLIGINEVMIPTGKRYTYQEFEQKKAIGVAVLDNCFALSEKNGIAEVFLDGEKGNLRYWQETGPGKFNFIQLFTPAGRDTIAIEPMTCNIDAFNNGEGLIELEPKEKVKARFGFELISK